MIRNYTDAHPNESCTGCPFNIAKQAKCTYKSKKYYCYRDQIWDEDQNAEPLLFDNL